jgi:protoheme IX farnesyltransferase
LPGWRYNDYSKAGFKLLPDKGGPTKYAAVQALLYSIILVPLGALPYVTGMSGVVSLVIVCLANLFMIWQCVRLFREMDVKAARRVMFSSYIYLPVVLLALWGDKGLEKCGFKTVRSEYNEYRNATQKNTSA